MHITYEEIGKLFVKSIKCKFPGALFKENLVRFINNNTTNTNIENIEITPLGRAILEQKTYDSLKSESTLFKEYFDKFKKENLGVDKTLYSPRASVLKKLNEFVLKYKASQKDVLAAVDLYHYKMKSENDIKFSLDAQYFIKRNDESLLLEYVNEIKNGETVDFSKDLVYGNDD